MANRLHGPLLSRWFYRPCQRNDNTKPVAGLIACRSVAHRFDFVLSEPGDYIIEMKPPVRIYHGHTGRCRVLLAPIAIGLPSADELVHGWGKKRRVFLALELAVE